VVVDPLSVLTRGLAATGGLARHPAAFFQGNRFLLPDLVGAVLESTPPTHAVMDLYAGVGLFTVAFAATGRNRITAIEGDKTSGRDLRNNAAPYPAIETVIGSVEDYVRRSRPRANTIVVDPPRTGMSRDAADSIIAHRAERIVYVSCDPPTMARDARRLLDGGYRLLSLRGFDLFPNTPHVETMGVFELC
jgi:23S rRNA (uracil1939-C5)-methyltransferase